MDFLTYKRSVPIPQGVYTTLSSAEAPTLVNSSERKNGSGGWKTGSQGTMGREKSGSVPHSL